MLGTGVLIRLATEPESEAVEHARRRGDFTLQPESLLHDFTADFLALASDTWADGAIELLGDMGIAGLRVSRWAFMSAPHRIDLTTELETRLAALLRT
jgi:hypothetical protein